MCSKMLRAGYLHQRHGHQGIFEGKRLSLFPDVVAEPDQSKISMTGSSEPIGHQSHTLQLLAASENNSDSSLRVGLGAEDGSRSRSDGITVSSQDGQVMSTLLSSPSKYGIEVGELTHTMENGVKTSEEEACPRSPLHNNVATAKTKHIALDGKTPPSPSVESSTKRKGQQRKATHRRAASGGSRGSLGGLFGSIALYNASDPEPMDDLPSTPSVATSLPRAVRGGQWSEVAAIMKQVSVQSELHEMLLSQNMEGGCGILMLAANAGKEEILVRLAATIQDQLGTTLLARHLRSIDDKRRPLLFHATSDKSTPVTFRATRNLLTKTLGTGGFEEQLKGRDIFERNILMTAVDSKNKVRLDVWNVLQDKGLLMDQLRAKDKQGMGVLMYAAQRGDDLLVADILAEDEKLAETKDHRGWTVLMHAASAPDDKVLRILRDWYAQRDIFCEELKKVAQDQAGVLAHAAVGGKTNFDLVRQYMSKLGHAFDAHPVLDAERAPLESIYLQRAAQGGSVTVLKAVAKGIKASVFKAGIMPHSVLGWPDQDKWYTTKTDEEEERNRLKAAVRECADLEGGSLFMFAIESQREEMMKSVVEGIRKLFPNREERWSMLYGFPGKTSNPLSLAATLSVRVFKATLKALKDECACEDGEVMPELLEKLMPPAGSTTPLQKVVSGNSIAMFDAVMTGIQEHCPEGQPTGEQIIRQVHAALNTSSGATWISAIMLPKLLKAAADADMYAKVGFSAPYDITLLDGAVKTAVARDAFDHLRTLIQHGCRIAKEFPGLLEKIGMNEGTISDFIGLAIAAAKNPFGTCSIALQDIKQAREMYPLNRGALDRLHRRVVNVAVELLQHLPQSVYGVGAELARGDPELDPYVDTAKTKPSELLGFIVVRWMLGCSIEIRSAAPGTSSEVEVTRRTPLIVHAIKSGTTCLDLLSAPLFIDYLRLEFTRTLPSWNSSDPFARSVNKTFFTYEKKNEEDGHEIALSWQLLLQWLNGSGPTENPLNQTLMPGLQFTLAGLIGKPGAFYPVPALRMMLIVLGYVATMTLYVFSVKIEDDNIPYQEWSFYVFMVGAAYRELLEFIHSKSRARARGSRALQRYFHDPWNFVDVTTIMLVIVAFVLRVTGNTSAAQLFLAATAPFLFSRVLFLSQIGAALGPMTQVIFKMMTELAQFSVIFVIVMTGFAVCFNALYGEKSNVWEDYRKGDQSNTACDPQDHPLNDAFGTFGVSLLTLFEAMLGEYNFSVFDDRWSPEGGAEVCDEVDHRGAGVVLLVAYLVVMAVMLLNLLIAVLSTAHANIYQDAEKQFHLARATLILQSRDDVLHDVLPPPFNLIKPIVRLVWFTILLGGEDNREIATLAIHRLIFALFMGLPAVALLTALWAISLPLVAWNLAHRLMARSGRVPVDELGASTTTYTYGGDVTEEEADQGNTAIPDLRTLLVGLGCLIVASVTAPALCLLMYPALSLLLWGRGVFSLWQYVVRSRKQTPWIRRQIALGEDGEEWSAARARAIKRNESYRSETLPTKNFNVAALLTTTTGMTMADVRERSRQREYRS